MNYRHAYHAGGIADAFKHMVLIASISRMAQKDAGYLFLDTHAGIGRYDLSGPEARKTGEYRSGIGKLQGIQAASGLLARYLEQVAAFNPSGELVAYPGSPAIAAALLRPQDRGVFCELHDEDVIVLSRALRNIANAAVHRRDGYEALNAFLPPPEKRAVVLIDPPFESTAELDRAAAALVKAHARMPNGVFAFWYPVKERPALWRFQEAMIATCIPRQTTIEFLTGDEGDSRILSGSGMLLINAPFGLEAELRPALEEVRQKVAPAGRVRFEVLAGE